jgi:hypothetical protein
LPVGIRRGLNYIPLGNDSKSSLFLKRLGKDRVSQSLMKSGLPGVLSNI